MDCPAEEALLRAKLEGFEEIRHLDFDLPQRQLTIYHEGESAPLEKALAELQLGEALIASEESREEIFREHSNQKKLLLTVLAINFAFFLIEMATGLLSRSMGLVADSLDMLADMASACWPWAVLSYEKNELPDWRDISKFCWH